MWIFKYRKNSIFYFYLYIYKYYFIFNFRFRNFNFNFFSYKYKASFRNRIYNFSYSSSIINFYRMKNNNLFLKLNNFMPFFIRYKFQDFSNLNSINISYFNDYLNRFLILILFIILFLFYYLTKYSFFLSLNKNIDRNILEIFWTLIPTIIILLISIPSIIILYFTDEFKKPLIDFKIIGNQWYWTYIYTNFNYFNSYIFPSILNRCIRTDNSIILPSNTNIRTIISSTDVIHSWTISSLIIKIDAVPGRLNSLNIFREKSMKIKGQCSEICGSNHRFIPISLIIIKFSSKIF